MPSVDFIDAGSLDVEGIASGDAAWAFESWLAT
jgi:hypothetical protein